MTEFVKRPRPEGFREKDGVMSPIFEHERCEVLYNTLLEIARWSSDVLSAIRMPKTRRPLEELRNLAFRGANWLSEYEDVSAVAILCTDASIHEWRKTIREARSSLVRVGRTRADLRRLTGLLSGLATRLDAEVALLDGIAKKREDVKG